MPLIRRIGHSRSIYLLSSVLIVAISLVLAGFFYNSAHREIRSLRSQTEFWAEAASRALSPSVANANAGLTILADHFKATGEKTEGVIPCDSLADGSISGSFCQIEVFDNIVAPTHRPGSLVFEEEIKGLHDAFFKTKGTSATLLTPSWKVVSGKIAFDAKAKRSVFVVSIVDMASQLAGLSQQAKQSGIDLKITSEDRPTPPERLLWREISASRLIPGSEVVVVASPAHEAKGGAAALIWAFVGIFAFTTLGILSLTLYRLFMSMRLEESQQELFASFEKFTAITTHLADGFFVKAVADSRVLEVNHTLLRMLDLTDRDQVIGRSFESVFDGWQELPKSLSPLQVSNEWTLERRGAIETVAGRRLFFEVQTKMVSEPGQPPYVLGLVRDITEEEKRVSHLADLATTDELTGLANRRLFVDRIQQGIAAATKEENFCAVLVFDLDHFKRINDTHSHLVGDEFLRQTAIELTRVVRTVDTVARLSGDGFGVLLTDIEDPVQIEIVVSRMLEAFREPIEIEGHELVVTATIGVSVFPVDAEDPDELLHQAEKAMYEGKSTGRDREVFANKRLSQRVRDVAHLSQQIRMGLRNNDFELEYQPVINVETGEVVRLEALARWKSHIGKNVSPDEFISIAEESGLIFEFGEWVIKEACKAALRLQDLDLWAPISINISTKHLLSRGFIGFILKEMGSLFLPASALEVEVTELSPVEDYEAMEEVISTLRFAGVWVSLDNFGTGYSSLGRLAKARVSTLKLDRTVVYDALVNRSSARLIRVINSMATGLRINLVAEGIESLDQSRKLRDMGCVLQQGFALSKPTSLDSVIKMITSRYWGAGLLDT